MRCSSPTSWVRRPRAVLRLSPAAAVLAGHSRVTQPLAGLFVGPAGNSASGPGAVWSDAPSRRRREHTIKTDRIAFAPYVRISRSEAGDNVQNSWYGG